MQALSSGCWSHTGRRQPHVLHWLRRRQRRSVQPRSSWRLWQTQPAPSGSWPPCCGRYGAPGRTQTHNYTWGDTGTQLYLGTTGHYHTLGQYKHIIILTHNSVYHLSPKRHCWLNFKVFPSTTVKQRPQLKKVKLSCQPWYYAIFYFKYHVWYLCLIYFSSI